ncbi:MAG: bifunctional glutamate N-acetyltransferase/amino-acid acetyltransferase ArgJ [Planctomycetota bacterium]|jgi:glutamate N-acetyltransferase/amino-acid N-acetyltransferase
MASRHITVPKGFVAAGVKCGIKSSGKEDLAIFAAGKNAPCAIVTTRNQLAGAAILWCRSILPRGYGRCRAMVVNSGVSNACTGKAGLRDAQAMATMAAEALGTDARKVLVASTGIIGPRLPMAKIRAGIASAAKRLARKNDSAALKAMMTTDTREKSAVAKTHLAGKAVTVAGIAKGSGMIAPSLATMIAVITTDAAVAPPALHKALGGAAAASFNAVTIDSDTSPSDIVAVFASGEAKNKTITTGSPAFKKFTVTLSKVCLSLARAIAADGEGATKLIEVHVRGARSAADAETAAKAVANSPLFKCAVHGCDPNWGRIAAALGKSAAHVQPEKLKIKIGLTTVFSGGRGKSFDAAKVAKYLGRKRVEIRCELGLGRGAFTALTCDLSRAYVTINSEYHT